MTTRDRGTRIVLMLAVLALVAAACGDDDETATTTAAPTTAAPTTMAPTTMGPTTMGPTTMGPTTMGPTTMAPTTTAPPMAGDLSQCPNPIVLQTDWFPEPEHGSLYELTKGQGSIDPDTGHFQGPLYADPSITIEIRSGGPYIGFQLTTALLYTDDSILLGYVSTDEQIANYEDTPTVAVMGPLNKNPQILMWDPETYDFESFSDIGETDAVVNVFPGLYVDYLIGTGQVDEEQFDFSYDGSPTRFIAEQGAIVQQGFATNEPYAYENIFTDWGRPVDFLLIHDSGFEIYSQSLGIRPDKLESEATVACLQALIPLIQQSAIDFIQDPSTTNEVILQAVEDLASFWVLTPDGVADAVAKMRALDIVGNGPDDTLGNFDLDRVQSVIDQVRDIPSFNVQDVTADDLVTNEFIDPSIGL